MTPAPPAPPAQKGDSAGRMIGTMGAIGFACGLLIVLTFQLTFPIIEQNKAEALEKAIFEVVPGAATKRAFALQDGGLVAVADDAEGQKYFACYDDAQQLIGIAIEAEGQGFQDVLRIIYGYSPDNGTIGGLKVLASKETPGLGDKIEKDPVFRANFDALEVSLQPETGKIAHPITFVKRGEKTDPWQVEGITGATISSSAIAKILEQSTTVALPLLGENMETLREGAQSR